MIFKTGVLAFLTLLFGLVGMSMVHSKPEDSDYKTAITLAEKSFSTFKINRNDYKLIEIKNDILNKNAENWRITYLAKSCISKEGLRNCLGGELFVSINIKTCETKINWGE